MIFSPMGDLRRLIWCLVAGLFRSCTAPHAEVLAEAASVGRHAIGQVGEVLERSRTQRACAVSPAAIHRRRYLCCQL